MQWSNAVVQVADVGTLNSGVVLTTRLLLKGRTSKVAVATPPNTGVVRMVLVKRKARTSTDVTMFPLIYKVFI